MSSAGSRRGTFRRPGPGTPAEARRVLVLTDSDSYVKWGAALAGRVPPAWHVRFVIARGSAEPSERQVREALEGTVVHPEDVERVGLEQVREVLRAWRPDVLVAGARGLTVQALIELAVPNRADRPVIVSGLPGIAVPVLPYGLGFRRSVDLFLVHSHRERRAFAEASRSLGIPHRYALATLPFLPTPEPSGTPGPARNRIIFAAQSLVPESREERRRLLRQLVSTALAHPDLEVVVKVRGRVDEHQTHADQHPYPELLAELRHEGVAVPDNLVVESGPMAAHLRRAVGLVTVSSTAILEAVAAGVPALALTDFGVEARQINLVFADSGLLQSSAELVAGRFRHPDPQWREDNYFHSSADDTWIQDVEELLEQRATEGLPPYPTAEPTVRHRVAMVFYRHQAFRSEPTGLTGALWRRVVERAVVATALRVSRSSFVVTRRFKPARTAPMGDPVDSPTP